MGGTFRRSCLSLPRHDKAFTGLFLQERLGSAGIEPRCGLLVIDLRSGAAAEWLRLEEPVCELYDVIVLPGVMRPRLVGFKSHEIRARVRADPEGPARLNCGRSPDGTAGI